MDEKTIKEAARRSEQYQKDQDAAGEEDREEFSGNRDSQTSQNRRLPMMEVSHPGQRFKRWTLQRRIYRTSPL